MKQKPRVLISVPNTGWVHKHVVFALVRLLSDSRHRAVLIQPTWRPYEHNLNRIRGDFLAQGWDFWLNIDADNPPAPRSNPLDLIDSDLDLVGFPTIVWHSAVRGDRPWYLNVMQEVPGGWRPWQDHGSCDGLQEVGAVGTGCFLASRRIMEAMPPFARVYDANGLVERGHDYEFCRLAKDRGFRIWADFSRPCLHFNELCLNEIVESFARVGRSPGQPTSDSQREETHG